MNKKNELKHDSVSKEGWRAIRKKYFSYHSQLAYWVLKDFQWFFFMDEITDRVDMFIDVSLRLYNRFGYRSSLSTKLPMDFLYEFKEGQDHRISKMMLVCHEWLHTFEFIHMHQLNHHCKWNVTTEDIDCIPHFEPRSMSLSDSWKEMAAKQLYAKTGTPVIRRVWNLCRAVFSGNQILSSLSLETADLGPIKDHIALIKTIDDCINLVVIDASKQELHHVYFSGAGQLMVNMMLAWQHNAAQSSWNSKTGLVYGIISDGSRWCYWKFDGSNFMQGDVFDQLARSTDGIIYPVIASKILFMVIDSLLSGDEKLKIKQRVTSAGVVMREKLSARKARKILRSRNVDKTLTLMSNLRLLTAKREKELNERDMPQEPRERVQVATSSWCYPTMEDSFLPDEITSVTAIGEPQSVDKVTENSEKVTKNDDGEFDQVSKEDSRSDSSESETDKAATGSTTPEMPENGNTTPGISNKEEKVVVPQLHFESLKRNRVRLERL